MTTAELIDAILDDLRRALTQVEPAEVKALQAAILAARRVFIAGKGRSGLQMKALGMRLMHLGFSVHVVDDVTTPAIGAGDLLLIGSSSGRTASLLRYVESAKAAGAELAVITGNPKSDMAAAADTLLRIPASNFKAGRESGLQSVLVMGSLFEHSLGLIGDLLIIRLKGALAMEENEMNARHANLE